jgi:hypothetical protein
MSIVELAAWIIVLPFALWVAFIALMVVAGLIGTIYGWLLK